MKSFTLTTIPSLAGLILVASYLPQLHTTFSTRSAEGHSLLFWILMNLALGGLFVQQIGLIKYEGNTKYAGAIVQGINLLLAFIMLVMVIVF